MKCIKCNADNNLKARKGSGGRCTKCGERFAFEPSMDLLKLTDPRFLRAIERAGGGGRGVSFTDRQLAYVLDKSFPRGSGARNVVGFLIVVGGAVLITSLFRWNFLIVIAAVFAIWMFGRKRLWYRLLGNVWPALDPARPQEYQPKVDPDSFSTRVKHWEEAHGPIEKLVRRPASGWQQTGLTLLQTTRDPDLTSYSFDRAVVTERADTAAMLVANNFHFENDCAILSYDGYPGAMAPTIKDMLRRNPRLQVFCVHDASPQGCLLPHKLRSMDWFPDRHVPILDLGLRPKHAMELGLPVRPGSNYPDPELSDVLTQPEIAWLKASRTAEVAAIPPARLLQGIFRGMAKARPQAQAQAPQPQPASQKSRWPLLAGLAALFAFLPWVASHGDGAGAYDGEPVDVGTLGPGLETEEERRRHIADGGSSGGSDGGSDGDGGGFNWGWGWSDTGGDADVFAADSFG